MLDRLTDEEYAQALLLHADEDDFIHGKCQLLALDAFRHPMHRSGMFCEDLHVVFDDGNLDLAESCAKSATDPDAKAILSRMASLDWPHRVLVMAYIDQMRGTL